MKKFSDVCVGFVKNGMPVFTVFNDKTILDNITFDESHYGLPVFTTEHAYINKGNCLLIGCGNTDMKYDTFEDIINGRREYYLVTKFEYDSHKMLIIAAWLNDLRETTDFNFLITNNRIIVDNNEIYGTINFLIDNTFSLAEETDLSEYYEMEI